MRRERWPRSSAEPRSLPSRDTGSMADPPLWLFADQLGPHVHGDREIVLVESAATRCAASRSTGRSCTSCSPGCATWPRSSATGPATCAPTPTAEALERVGRPVLVHEPTSHAAPTLVERLRKEGLVAEILPTPTFALSRKEFAELGGRPRARSGWRTSTAPSDVASTC